MSEVREAFELIFSVPGDVFWSGNGYLPKGEQPYAFESMDRACEMDSRLEGYQAAQSELAALREELADCKRSNEILRNQAPSEIYAQRLAVVERQPVDAILLENCEEVTVQDYGRGYFATDDCVTQLYTSPPAQVSTDIAHDRAYRNGMMAGFQFGISGNEKGYALAIANFNSEIHAAKGEPPAPVAVLLDERAEFENYYRDRIMGNRTGVRFLRSASGSYLDSEVREMWSGWQARACLDKVKELNQ